MINDNLGTNINFGSEAEKEAAETSIALGRKLGLLLSYLYSDDDRNKVLELVETMDAKQLFEFTNALDSAYHRALEQNAAELSAVFKKEFEALMQSYNQSQKRSCR